MLVEDCSKRALTHNRELGVPPKKRKHLHEESVLYDISINQYLQDSDPNVKVITENYPNFEKQNSRSSTPSASEKGFKEGKIEFNLQPSIYVKADDSAEWIKLKCFDSIIDGSNGATFFSGGPIQSSAFSVMHHDTKVNQYVAIAASDVIYNKHSCTNTNNMCGIIQFWNVGSLHGRKTLNQSPSMELALCHDNGMITQMKWCPADCYDKCPPTSHLPRLGLLAVSSSSSFVYIYSVPQPAFMPKSKPSFPIYFTSPLMKLIPLFGGPSYVTKEAVATCIDWEKNGERIVAGYANGAVCVWMVKLSSFPTLIRVKNTEKSYNTIRPYLFFQASGGSIANLSFAPSNYRWLVVSSIDKTLRFFDLEDASAPFHVVKQGLENSCIWADTFCGVYSSPALNSIGLLSLFAKDSCIVSNDKGIPKGYLDASTNVAVSEKKNFHAIADMAGAVTVNFLKNISKPYETSYLTYMILETEIMALGSIDLALKASKDKISISGTIPSKNDPVSEIKETLYTKIRQGSASSSSGFCSPKNGKIIVIEMTKCFNDTAVNLLESSSTSINDFTDINSNGIKTPLDKSLNSEEEANDEMIKCFGYSGDLMHELLMLKISNQSKSLSHILPFNISNNSACCDSKGANNSVCCDSKGANNSACCDSKGANNSAYCDSTGDRALVTSPAASNYTGDTIIYPIEPCFWDTSHQNILKCELDAQSKILGSKNEDNAIHQTSVHKKNVKSALKTELCIGNSLNSSADLKLGNSSQLEDSSSKKWCELNNESCYLNYKSKNLKKINYFNNDYNSFHSNDFSKEGYHVSKKFPKEKMGNVETPSQNLNTSGSSISQKDIMKLSLSKSYDYPSCDVFESNILNQPKPLKSICSSIKSNDLIVCDKAEQLPSDRALFQSSVASDYSGDTIIYFSESHDSKETDANNLKMEKPGATFQSLCKSEKENTFQDNLLHKMDEKEMVIYGSNTKPLTENSSSCAREKCKHFLTKESQRCNSEYESESIPGSSSLSDKNRNVFQKNLSISDFQLLHSKYLCEKSEGKHSELLENDKDLEGLSYENLIASFGVIFKNNLDKSSKPLKHQEHDIYINNNPLSVIKTISWNPNEGCQSWLFVGGNSGIGRLVFVPDFVGSEKKPRTRRSQKLNVS